MQSPSNQPTNQPTSQYPTYISLRLTVAHELVEDMRATVLEDTVEYIIYKHKPGTTNEHVHILIPGSTDKKDLERYRKRAKVYLGKTGRSNAVACKPFDNGLEHGCQYCSHEPSVPIVSSDLMQAVVDNAPAYVHRDEGQRMLPKYNDEKPERVRDWQLTYSNLVPQAINHARKYSLTGSLKAVVKDMITRTKWRPCKQMYVCGVNEAFEKDFEFRTGKRKEPDMGWWRSSAGL